MIEAKVTLINLRGLHARAASKLVNTASQYASEITLIKEGKSADAKSIMAVMMLAAALHCELTIKVNGSDEDDALSALIKLIEARFGEEE